MKKLNIFEIIGKINKDFGNLVFIPRSFPSIDVKLTGDDEGMDIIKIRTYSEDEPECPVGYLTIKWKRESKTPVYHFKGYQEQTSDGETDRWDEVEYESSDIRNVVREVLNCITGSDEPSHDEEPDCWESGLYPDEYFDRCFENYMGIFGDIQFKKLSQEWS